jgi:hypothetical protein
MKIFKWTVTAAAVALTLIITRDSAAATIFGTIQENRQPIPNGTPVVLNCGGNEVARTVTDPRGSYRLTTNRTGPCSLQVRGLNAEVILYQDPTSYDFEILGSGNQSRLIRR